MDDIPLSAQFGALILLLILAAFFSIAETSMMALNRYRLKHLVKQGHRGAKLAHALLAHTDRLLGVILLGNNLVNAAAAVLVGLITIRLFGENKIALGLGTLAITFLILVFAEITPKVIGAAHAERIAFAVSYVLTPLLRLLYPVVWFVNLFVSALLALMCIKPPAGGEPPRLSAEELRSLVLEAGHYIPKKHRSILVNLFDLERITVEDVMTPRAQIEAVDLEAPLERIVEQLATSYHTRLLVYRNELGNIAGILHLRKVLALMREGDLERDKLAELLTEPYFIPASTPLFAQLQYFQENRQRFALVVDEYGELQGLMTLEDIIEEIIGEFTTNSPSVASIRAWDKNDSALVQGASPLRELNRKLGLALPLDGPKTLNGLIIEHFQDIPEAGVSLKIAGVPMEIVQTQDRVVKTVRLFKPKAQVLPTPGKS
ncbi:MAG: magnesium and cobalt efflux protein CorC [Betaproteobacteria bacterium RIFCSPLOWO2_12_FULL_62_13b]|nr:MAG: magnesium and cobalt efflux protein CorC [Betaproteobacteria bacterium RIFCSPLOWO2_12_FULL_62_13b]